ncbi:MAG: tRNA (adenosine(37)-N6)-threonylcarbamoyltransferase complex transferase subunit TsaD [Bacteroidetes bacterium]|nr:tRNA (adenosine(37)-N6)-threonylcarbamoyltransferase complex transferase subunit TsaD [Bacteroidota bacterium]
MILLGIETSCDETSAAIIKDGVLLSNVTVVQYFHSHHGGVVPELASRAHLRLIVPIVDEALQQAGISKNSLNGIAAVYGPGLIGSLLVGLSFGKALALGLGVPFVGINHMEAHMFANFIEEPKPSFPFVNLTVSGGHTQLVYIKDYFDYEVLGTTLDDAAGEAFDKVAKMLGIGYPGGPLVDRLARNGNPDAIPFPRPWLESDSLNFSFSGLKTSVLFYLRRVGFNSEQVDEQFVKDVCASFQASVIDVLVGKLMKAAEKKNVQDVAVSGGVAANSALRKRLEEVTQKHRRRLFVPKIEYCTDNAAMVALVGYERLRRGIGTPFEIEVEPNLQLV